MLILARENGALDIFEVSARRDVAAPPAGTDSLDMQTRINCLMSCQHASSLPDSILPSPPSSNPSPNGAALHAGSNAEAGHPQGASQRRISQIVAASFDVRQERPEGQTEGNPKACSVSDALVLFVTSDGSFDVYRVASLPDSSEIALHKARGTAASRASMSGPTMSPSQVQTQLCKRRHLHPPPTRLTSLSSPISTRHPRARRHSPHPHSAHHLSPLIPVAPPFSPAAEDLRLRLPELWRPQRVRLLPVWNCARLDIRAQRQPRSAPPPTLARRRFLRMLSAHRGLRLRLRHGPGRPRHRGRAPPGHQVGSTVVGQLPLPWATRGARSVCSR